METAAKRVRAMILAALFSLGCTRDSDPSTAVQNAFRSEAVALHVDRQSRLPRFAAAADGGIVLSWVEENATDTRTARADLCFAWWRKGQWTTPIRVASGEQWFVNWADFPAMAILEERNLVAHFLQRSAGGTYDYQVFFVLSTDAGETWSEPVRLHADPGPGEHGFVSLVPLDEGTCAAVWLDGRNMQSHGAGPGPGAMALYARTVGIDGALGAEILLDERVCDCCPTAAVRTSDGALVAAYRDRSGEEVRDISLVRFGGGSAPEHLWNSRDGWKIAGCPVNGPVLACADGRIGLVWFTPGSDGDARILCALSEDGGESFSAPTRLGGEHVQGRVDAVFDDHGRLVVVWLEADGHSAEWRVARIDRDGRALDEHAVVAATGARESGLARLARAPEGILFAWTDVVDPPRVAVQKLVWE